MARKKKAPTPLIRGPWSRKDIRYLRKYFGNTPTKEVAKDLNRPDTAVRKMASRLGLRKSKRHMKKLGKTI